MWPRSTDCPWYPSERCFPVFSSFPAFLGFSVNSGGPSLPFGAEVPEWPEVARMATFGLSVTSGTLGTPLDPAGSSRLEALLLAA